MCGETGTFIGIPPNGGTKPTKFTCPQPNPLSEEAYKANGYISMAECEEE
jgi:hypothetical protein